MREQIAELVYNWLTKGVIDDERWLPWVKLEEEDRTWYRREYAAQILSLMAEEIEKVENPYSEAAKHNVHSRFHKEGFEDCRQAILKALEV